MSELGINYNVAQAGLFDKSYRDLRSTLKRPELASVAWAFISNCDRAFELMATHVNLVVYSIWFTRADREIRFAHGIGLDADIGSHPEYASALDARLQGLMDDRANNPHHWDDHWAAGAGVIEQYLQTNIFGPEGSIALLALMCIQGWMCFESLAVDLWKTLVNIHPSPLARNVLSGQPPLGQDIPRQDQKTIPLSVLDQYHFDLSHSMGDVLSRARRVNLDSLRGITDAYKVAFKSDFDPTIIDTTHLNRLEAIRNLHAHRGGRVDETFIRRMQGVDFIHPLEVGQDYVIAGDNVRDYMDIVIRSAMNLIHFADDWLDGKAGGSGSQADLGLDGSGAAM
ncbi:hypothetical protein [Phenylobacterium soli]|uniref:hypothetical protein n=1 Tax=Phenylobacterium soli TaxID=2170551 RepID=UPI001057F328|nr:hypothetical protein [Phenylobacterium soli]